MKFSTKAGTLISLFGTFKSALIPKIVVVNYRSWNSSASKEVKFIFKELGPGDWIVRSTAENEDSSIRSNAGAFLSIQHVNLINIVESINQVFNSYESLNENSQVLIQPMLMDVILSGVGFSHQPDSGAPYRTINWHQGSDTSVITGGKATGRVWQQVPNFTGQHPEFIAPVIQCMNELIDLFQNQPLDFEFAYTSKNNINTLWLLQVRPLIVKNEIQSDEDLVNRLKQIEEQIINLQKYNPFLVGDTTVFGIMPDWNPAEILGIRPKPLALSLYRELITDNIWAYQRNNYGYRNLRSFPLMTHFHGLPYVDIRVSFNSFIPNDIPDELAHKMTNYYIAKLIKEPTLHDKVEFEIVLSAYCFDIENSLNELELNGFNREETNLIKKSLLKLTNKIIDPIDGLWKKDSFKLDELKSRRLLIEDSNLLEIEKIYWLIEDAKRYGTLPFAGLARAGFIAIQVLKSIVKTGILSDSEYDNYLSSIKTVSKEFVIDKNSLNRSEFLNKYGHLRPGTYDIMSKRYDDDPDFYLSGNTKNNDEIIVFKLSNEQHEKIEALIKLNGLDTDVHGLFFFIENSIVLREFAKFEFTKNLSAALNLIKILGFKMGFSPEQMSYVDFHTIKELYFSSSSEKLLLSKSIENGMDRYKNTLTTSLPPLIIKPAEIFGFEWPVTSPNFITQKAITASVISELDVRNLYGKIVCIPNADPGYDWLFAHNIVGLITAWGGVNSHMAIRAGELGLPAVIGCGELLFKVWSSAEKLQIDCANNKVEIIL